MRRKVHTYQTFDSAITSIDKFTKDRQEDMPVVKYGILYFFVLFQLIIKNLPFKSTSLESLKHNAMVELSANKKQQQFYELLVWLTNIILVHKWFLNFQIF